MDTELSRLPNVHNSETGGLVALCNHRDTILNGPHIFFFSPRNRVLTESSGESSPNYQFP